MAWTENVAWFNEISSMKNTPLIQGLIDALRALPGVGPKSAQRMAYHLLQRNRSGARHLAQALEVAAEQVQQCSRCRTLSEDPVCPTCASPRRDASQLCVVEQPAEILAFESAGGYGGLYYVLGGRLSPLDGMGPDELGLPALEHRLAEGEVKELILATSPTVEGEATAHYLIEMARSYGIRVTRIAHGVPLGGELEYVDSTTLGHALALRREV